MNTPYAEGHREKPTRLEKEPPVPEGHCGDSARLEWEAPIFRRGPGALSEKCSCCRPPRGGVQGRGRTRPLPVLRRKGRARGLQKRDRRLPGGRLVVGLWRNRLRAAALQQKRQAGEREHRCGRLGDSPSLSPTGCVDIVPRGVNRRSRICRCPRSVSRPSCGSDLIPTIAKRICVKYKNSVCLRGLLN